MEVLKFLTTIYNGDIVTAAFCITFKPFDIEKSFSHKVDPSNIVTFKNMEFYPNTFVKTNVCDKETIRRILKIMVST